MLSEIMVLISELILLKGVYNIPVTAESVHKLHNEKSFPVSHFGTFLFALGNCLKGCYNLILIAAYLWRSGIMLLSAVVENYVNSLTVVDVMELNSTLCTVDYAFSVKGTVAVAVKHSGFTVGIGKYNGIMHINAVFILSTVGSDVHNILAESHNGKIKCIYTKIKERAPCQFGLYKPVHM